MRRTIPQSSNRIPVPALTLTGAGPTDAALTHALRELGDYCRASAGIDVRSSDAPARDEAITVCVGRSAALEHAPASMRGIDFSELGREGFVLRIGSVNGRPCLVAAGGTDLGTRHAVYELMCRLDVTTAPPSLPGDLDLLERPSFGLRGMYAHQHWAYLHPYALRSWSVDDWKHYVDMLALMKVNLFQIWSMAGIVPMPPSPGDRAFLERYPAVIDYAKRQHGMEVWIGECANNMCQRRDLPPIEQRYYFHAETRIDPSNARQIEELRAAREEFYRICGNADGYWVLDSDPGGWEGSPPGEFVDLLMMNRALIDQHTQRGCDAKLIYWMWLGWGDRTREENWRETVRGLIDRAPEPWWMTVAHPAHWKVVDELGLEERTLYFPYGPIEPEPSMPFTTLIPDVLRDCLHVPGRAPHIRGIMGNAQTPLCQLPNIHYLTSTAWNLDGRTDASGDVAAGLARMIYPERASLVARAWLSLSSPDAPEADELSNELAGLAQTRALGRPGPIGRKLFPDFELVARDLAIQLRIHGIAMDFCRSARDHGTLESALPGKIERYCLESLAWRRRHGFNTYGTNGCNFFPLREAAHRHWWRGDHLDRRINDRLERAMRECYDEWEADLILFPLDH